MLYNTEKKKVQNITDCFSCKYFDKKLKRCSGINAVCYEYDNTTNTIIDGLTGLPIKNEKGE